MYSAPYGYGTPAGQPYNGAPPGQNPQMQPGPGPNQQQQQMMYNQQFPMGPGGAFPGVPNPNAMMPGGSGAGPAGMMQNTAMPQMAANGQMGFQTPYTSSSYGPSVPSTAAAQGQFNPNYMMAGSMGGFPMNAAGMTPQQQQAQQQQHQQQAQQQQQQQQQHQQHQQQHQQHHHPHQQQHPHQHQHPHQQQQQQHQHPHQQQQQHQHQQMMQRMQQAQQNQGGMGTPTPQRQFSGPQGTPNPTQQSQYGTPQHVQSTPQNQTPTPAPPSANSVTTPQTPTFPSTGQGPIMNGNSTPVSPGTQAKDSERLGLLLDINTELLYELMHLKHSLEEIKREAAGATNGNMPDQQKERKDEEEAFQQDLAQVHRRLQANLSYMASLTTAKPEGTPRLPAPVYLSPPPVNLNLKFRPLAPTPDAEKVNGSADREERFKYIREQYQKLHTLFPGIDPTKEPTFRPQPKSGPQNPAMAMQNAQRMATMGAMQGQMQANAVPSPVSLTHQTTPQMSAMAAPGMHQPVTSAQ